MSTQQKPRSSKTSPSFGRPPFGYRIAIADTVARERRLEPDPETSPVVRRIFTDYLSGLGLQAIAARLTAEDVTRPSVYDRVRNPHHNGSAWSKGAVRGIIVNPRYLGSGCQAEGSEPGEEYFPALVSADIFGNVQRLLSERGASAKSGQGRSHAFRGMLRCALCRRLMQGTWNNNAPYYRCRVFRETAEPEESDHPANVYLPESRMLRPLQCWLAEAVSAPAVRMWIRAQLASPLRRPAHRLEALQQALHLERLGPDARSAVYQALNTRLLYLPEQGVIQIRAGLLPGAASEGIVVV
jgi:hypothetical protein